MHVHDAPQRCRVAVSHQSEVKGTHYLQHDHRQPQKSSQRFVVRQEPFHFGRGQSYREPEREAIQLAANLQTAADFAQNESGAYFRE